MSICGIWVGCYPAQGALRAARPNTRRRSSTAITTIGGGIEARSQRIIAACSRNTQCHILPAAASGGTLGLCRAGNSRVMCTVPPIIALLSIFYGAVSAIAEYTFDDALLLDGAPSHILAIHISSIEIAIL